jgi:hypothetical protein
VNCAMRYRCLRPVVFSMGALLLIQFGAQGARVDPDAINNADWRGLAKDEALLTKTQVLLDRAFFSPGEIDAVMATTIKQHQPRSRRIRIIEFLPTGPSVPGPGSHRTGQGPDGLRWRPDAPPRGVLGFRPSALAG